MKENNRKERKGKWLLGGGIVAAFTASLCCIGPAVFIAMGLGSFAAAGVFETLRPWLALVAVIALGFAWRQALRKNVCADGRCETTIKNRKGQIALLSLVSMLAIGFLAYPSLANWMLNASEDTQIAMGPNSSELRVSIPTMDCAACAVGIQGELNKIEGIDSAQISYDGKQALIVYDSQVIEEQKILEAIKATGFPPEKLKAEQSHAQ